MKDNLLIFGGFVLVFLFVFGFVAFILALPQTTYQQYPEANIICIKHKDFGLKPAQSACYEKSPIKSKTD